MLDLRRAHGIAGAETNVRRMCDAIAHRGPDDEGVWVDADAQVGLGHRRLAIIDLSPRGHQPMTSIEGRYVITYNGEVYNFLDLREELESCGHRFRGDSDTEVMLAAFSAWGIERAVGRFLGMFALAVWDRDARVLHLVRDRMGVKPLFWSQQEGLVLFGSELKALMAHPDWNGIIDTDAVAAFVRHSYVPSPATIFRNVRKVPPATILSINSEGNTRQTTFWSLRGFAAQGAKAPVNVSDADAEDQLDALLRDAVRRRMIADVPLGAFLSGGIDSSVVVALMQAQSSRKVRTFSIGFDQASFDEAPYAKAVAAHLGTDHTELYVSASAARNVIPRLPEMFDEPFADASQIPTFLVSSMTRKHVTVALSGDGGDELFAGYPRYQLAQSLWRALERTPPPLRRAVGAGLQSLSETAIDRMASAMPDRLRLLNAGNKVHRLAALLQSPASAMMLADLSAVWPNALRLVPHASSSLFVAEEPDVAEAIPDLLARMQYGDMRSYLPDDILVKVDRCSMVVALEAREPLLDHRLVEFACSLPRSLKMRHGESKWVLRRVLQRYVPRVLTDRPKRGFSVPLGDWLRGPLRTWADSLLDAKRIQGSGLFDAAEVRRLWNEHQSGRANREAVLWNLLMFRAWQEHYRVA